MMPEDKKPRASKILTIKIHDPKDQRVVWAALWASGIDPTEGDETDIANMIVDWCHGEIKANQQAAEQLANGGNVDQLGHVSLKRAKPEVLA